VRPSPTFGPGQAAEDEDENGGDNELSFDGPGRLGAVKRP
jgi:hypothetical protein